MILSRNYVRANRESGEGRFDIQPEPKNNNHPDIMPELKHENNCFLKISRSWLES